MPGARQTGLPLHVFQWQAELELLQKTCASLRRTCKLHTEGPSWVWAQDHADVRQKCWGTMLLKMAAEWLNAEKHTFDLLFVLLKTFHAVHYLILKRWVSFKSSKTVLLFIFLFFFRLLQKLIILLIWSNRNEITLNESHKIKWAAPERLY